jgi:hypothetical protein
VRFPFKLDPFFLKMGYAIRVRHSDFELSDLLINNDLYDASLLPKQAFCQAELRPDKGLQERSGVGTPFGYAIRPQNGTLFDQT